jgi:hypothetical protein
MLATTATAGKTLRNPGRAKPRQAATAQQWANQQVCRHQDVQKSAHVGPVRGMLIVLVLCQLSVLGLATTHLHMPVTGCVVANPKISQ